MTIRTLLLGLVLISLCSLSLIRCGTWLSEENTALHNEKKEDKKNTNRRDFKIGRVTAQPGDQEGLSPLVKPGHWLCTIQEMKANHFDYIGELTASVVDNKNQPMELESTPFRLATTRPAALPKGQQKNMEMTLFVPADSRMTKISSSLRGHDLEYHAVENFGVMAPHRYCLLVLARHPERYAFIQHLDSVTAPGRSNHSLELTSHYQVLTPRADQRVPLPSHSLAWTSIAYLLWDDIDPDVLTAEQQQATLDWLHWGGQLIISGPGSLDSLQNSFLAPYLPAMAKSTRTYNHTDLTNINQTWTLPEGNQPGRPLIARQPWSGIELQRHSNGTAVPTTGGLLMARNVGRGRIVVSSFRLSEVDLIRWPGFDGFFNACLLNRPSREFSLNNLGMPSVGWAEFPDRRLEPRLTSNLRYFTRDAGSPTSAPPPTRPRPFPTIPPISRKNRDRQASPQPTPQQPPLLRPGGVASWNPFSATSNAAREVLREAAGLTVPKPEFVLWVLALYLLVLVPLNCLCFFLLGRLEWAWVAAPLIAVGSALVVIKLAQLDIGFARSQTEIAVLETQENYPRAHLTRYIALYTSLSSTYELRYDSLSAVAQPFPVDRDFQIIPGQTRPVITYRRYGDVRLSGLPIGSNTTGMVQSEEMYDLGGPLTLVQSANGTPTVANHTHHTIVDGVVLYRDVQENGVDQMKMCSIDTLRPGESAPLTFGDPTKKGGPTARNSDAVRESVHLDRLVALSEDPQGMQPGEIRLVGHILLDQPFSGLEITPASSQIKAVGLIIAHLRYGMPPPPKPDRNTRKDFSNCIHSDSMRHIVASGFSRDQAPFFP